MALKRRRGTRPFFHVKSAEGTWKRPSKEAIERITAILRQRAKERRGYRRP